jgi:hypothetical protein
MVTFEESLKDAGIQDWGPIVGILMMVIGFIGLLWTALAGCSKCG